VLDPSMDWMADLDVGNDAEDAEMIEVVEELFFEDVVDEGVACAAEASDAPAEGAPEPDTFVALVRVLEEAVLAQRADTQAIACLRALLGVTRIEDAPFDEGRTQALVDGGLVVRTADGVHRSDALARQVIAWRGILNGESDDFEGCGQRSLDEWSADLVARVVGGGGTSLRAESVRRELRRRGVAAFGLLSQAA